MTQEQEDRGVAAASQSSVSTPSARQMRMEWNADNGNVIFEYPSDLSLRDVEDVESLLALCVQGMWRRARLLEAANSENNNGN